VEDGEVAFLVWISVGIVEAHLVPGQDPCCCLTETVGQLVSLSLAFARVAAPARGIVPSVASAGGIHVDGNQADVQAAQLGANAVHPFAAFRQGNVFVFWYQERGIVMFSLEFGHNPPGNFPVVGPFKETAVRASLSCSFPAVSVVNEDFHRTQSLGCRSAVAKLLKVFQFPLFPPEPVHFLPVFPPLRSLAPVKAPAKEEFVDDQDAGKVFIQVVGPALGEKGRVKLLFTVILPEKAPEGVVNVVGHNSGLPFFVEEFRDECDGAEQVNDDRHSMLC